MTFLKFQTGRDRRGYVLSLGCLGAIVLGCGAAICNGQDAAPPSPRAAQDVLQAPGPERFAVTPKTPLEHWDAADYLVRSGQARLAAPYLSAFLQANPDDATLLEIREKFGLGSILRLQDDPSTSEFAKPILDRLAAASQRNATDSAALDQAIGLLTRSRAEQQVGVDRLRSAGPYAVPKLVERLGNGDLSPDERALIVVNMGRLQAPAVPPLIAALDSSDPRIAAAAAEALGRIGDKRALLALLFHTVRGEGPEGLKQAARSAVERLTRKSPEAQPRSAARMLADQAWRYHRGQVEFPSDTVEVWSWTGDRPAPESLDSREAATRLGIERARKALALEPGDSSSQVALVGLLLDRAARAHTPEDVVASDPDGAFSAALSAGPAILAEVLRTAVADGHGELAELAARALGRVSNRDALAVAGRTNPLVDALGAPNRRVQYAAARALVEMDPRQPFPGASRLVPILARFLNVQPGASRAVVIDGNPTRAGTPRSVLQQLGYDPQVAHDGREGFRLASESADVEFVLINPIGLQDAWSWQDTVENLRADRRTAGTPIFVAGPLNLIEKVVPVLQRFPRTAFLTAPVDAEAFRPLLERELQRMGIRQLSQEERAELSRGAAGLLARIAGQPGSPFGANIAEIEPALSMALHNPAAIEHAIAALGDVPGASAQQSLADVLLDPSKTPELRHAAGTQLVRSVQRFGPLLTPRQEGRIVESLAGEADGALRSSLSAVVGALQPEVTASGTRLRGFEPGQTPESAPRTSARESVGQENP
jgi:HEAT repeat protein